MPFGTITSTENTFGTVNGALSGTVAGTLTGSVGVPGPVGPVGPQGQQGPPGPPGVGGAWGSITGTLSAQIDLQTVLDGKYSTTNPSGFQTAGQVSTALAPYITSATATASFYPLSNPSNFATQSFVTGQGYITSSALSPYLLSSTASTTYQTLAGMSAYLTTSALTGYATQSFVASNYAPIAAGLPTGGTVGQVLTKNSGTDYDDSWQTLIPGDRYLTSSTTSLTINNANKTLTIGTGLSYSSQQDIVITHDAANHMHARVLTYNSGTGVMDVDVLSHSGSGTYATWTVNVGGAPALASVVWGDITGTLGNQTDLATALGNKLETSTAASTYAALAGATFTGEVFTPASTTSNAGLTITPGVAPTSPTNGEIWTTTNDLQIRLNGVTETVAEQSWVTSQGYLTSSALTPYAPLAGSTFTGLVTTVAPTTTTAGLNLPHGVAPTTPVNGDIWTTTSGLFARINAGTQQYAALGSNVTFSNSSSTFGSSTAAGTINVASGATISGSTKAVNIGTAGVVGSTTNITVGPVLGASTTSIGGTTAASTLNLATGATLTATTKAVNIGTSGVAGSTTTIAIGSTTGTSTTTLQGTTNGVTAAADTNSVALATTAFVVGQAGSATPLVNGTAAVGTSLRYARQDHVHGTDTTRAPLASPSFTGTVTIPAGASISGFAPLAAPTFTGVPAAPTAAVDTNTTQLATTAYVVAQAAAATPLVNGTAAVGTSLRYARADHVHPTDTTRAALASPALTGVPTAPTATAGTNTTQLATTAFVTAAVPSIATVAQTNNPSSNTVVMSPDKVRQMLMFPGFQELYGGGVNATSGAGASVSVTGNRTREFAGPSASVAGYSTFVFDTTTSSIGFYASVRGGAAIAKNFNRPFWFGSRTLIAFGDANNLFRAELGGRNLVTTSGDPVQQGIGWKVVGGGGNAIVFYLRTRSAGNGGTYSEVTTTFTPLVTSPRQYFDWYITHDGASTSQMYVNDVLVGTLTASFAGFQEEFNFYSDRIEQTASAATQMQAVQLPTRVFFSQ
jgi:hypothetical protein